MVKEKITLTRLFNILPLLLIGLCAGGLFLYYNAAASAASSVNVSVPNTSQPTITLSMTPTSFAAAGGSSLATIQVINSSATAQQCTLVGKDLQGKVVDTTDPTFTVPQGNQTAMKVIYGTSSQQWIVPPDWNNASNTIEVIGGGGGANNNTSAGGPSGRGSNVLSGAGGGGAYSKISNITLALGTAVDFVVGARGAANTNGGDTYFCNSSSNCASIKDTAVVVGAKGGSGATSTPGGSGGQASEGIGDTKYSGGNGGRPIGSQNGGGGGGGAAGPFGNGASGGNGNNSNNEGDGGGGNGGGFGGTGPLSCGSWPFIGNCGGPGGNNHLGKGSGAGADCGGNSGSRGPSGAPGTNGGGGGGGDECGDNNNGGKGGNGTDIDGTVGGGGGGGGGGGSGHTTSGGNGGFYGGGGGGRSNVGGNAGAGAQGIVVIRYVSTDASFTHKSSHVINTTTDFTVSCVPSGLPLSVTKSPTVRVTLKNDCTLGGVTVANGMSQVFYSTSLVPFGQSCSGNDSSGNPYSQSRMCTNGVLGGNSAYSYGSCSSAAAPPQTDVSLSANSTLVRSGASVLLTWDGGNSTSCSLTGTNGFSSSALKGSGVSSGPITQKADFNLVCTLGTSTKTASVTVNLIPVVQEI